MSVCRSPYRHQYEHLVIAKSSIHGRGVFVSADIERGDLIGVFEGDRVTRNGAYVLWVEDGDGSVYGLRGRNELRFVNHSDRPNAGFDGNKLFALQDIRHGEEVTFDYGDGWTSETLS